MDLILSKLQRIKLFWIHYQFAWVTSHTLSLLLALTGLTSRS
jgi:hypothetical protein